MILGNETDGETQGILQVLALCCRPSVPLTVRSRPLHCRYRFKKAQLSAIIS
jgi:hypothetical protein